MSLFAQVERRIQKAFSHWTAKMFGPADSGELVLVHHAILEEVERMILTVARGQRIFPFPNLTVTLNSPDADRRTLYHAAFAEGGRLENDIREALEASGCQVPRGFSVAVESSEAGGKAFEIDYRPRSRPAPAIGRLSVVKGKTERPLYALEKPRVNLGRMAEVADAAHRVLRRNDVVFLEGEDEANVTVSRQHAHIFSEGGVYRICDDGSEFGTRVFRDGRTIEVPSGDRRGERLRNGDEIHLGRTCLRFEQ